MRDAKPDANQSIIVAGLRKAGIRVADIHRHGDGVPDLLGYRPVTGVWKPLEVKRRGGKLTPAETEWWLRMGCEPIIIETGEDGLREFGVEVR